MNGKSSYSSSAPSLQHLWRGATARPYLPICTFQRRHYVPTRCLNQQQAAGNGKAGTRQRNRRVPRQLQQERVTLHRRGDSTTFNARGLTIAIQDSVGWQELHQLCLQHAPEMNAIHASAALSKLVKLLEADKRLMQSSTHAGRQVHGAHTAVLCIDQLARMAHAHVASFQPRAVANSLWATAKLLQHLDTLPAQPAQPVAERTLPQHTQPTVPSPTKPTLSAARGSVLALASGLVGRVPSSAQGFEPQHTSSVAYALALVAASQAQQQALTASSAGQPLADDAEEAFEIMHRGSDTQAADGLTPVRLQPDQLAQMTSALIQLAEPQLHHFPAQALSNTLYSAVQLGLQPPDRWMSHWLDASQPALYDFEPQHTSNSLWSLAKLGFFPGDEWVDAALRGAALKLPAFTPQGISNTLWALAQLNSIPQPQLLSALLRTLVQKAASLGPQDLANSLWALARLHEQLASQTPVLGDTAHGAGQAGSLEAADAWDTFSNVGQHHQKPDLQPAEVLSQQLGSLNQWAAGPTTGRHQPHSASTGHAASAAAVGAAHIWGGKEVVAHELRATGARLLVQSANGLRVLAAATPQHLANSMWAASVLRVQPPAAWSHAVLDASAAQMRGFSTQELSNLLLGCARLRVRPSTAWWAVAEPLSAALTPLSPSQHLANTAWAMAELGRRPGRAWTAVFLRRVVSLQSSGEMTPQATACILWAMARWRLQPTPSWLQCVLSAQGSGIAQQQVGEPLKQPHPSSQHQVHRITDPSSMEQALPQLHVSGWAGYSLQGLAMVLWSLARMGVGTRTPAAGPSSTDMHLRQAQMRSKSSRRQPGAEAEPEQAALAAELGPLLQALSTQLAPFALTSRRPNSSAQAGSSQPTPAAVAAVKDVGVGAARAIALCTWALGSMRAGLGPYPSVLLKQLGHAVLAAAPACDGRMLLQCAWGLSHVGVTAGRKLQVVLTSRLSQLVEASATMQHASVTLTSQPAVSSLARERGTVLNPHQQGLTSKQLAVTLLALTRLGCSLERQWVVRMLHVWQQLRPVEPNGGDGGMPAAAERGARGIMQQPHMYRQADMEERRVAAVGAEDRRADGGAVVELQAVQEVMGLFELGAHELLGDELSGMKHRVSKLI